MVIYGSARPPYGPVDIILEDGVISSIGAASRAVPSARCRDRRHRQVRDAGHRQHPHALARRAPARHAAADSVRAQPVPGGRRDDGPRGRRRFREIEAVAGARATRTRSSRRASSSTRWSARAASGTPAEIRAWIRDIAARGADGLKIIAVDRDQLEAILDEARTSRPAHHRAHRPSRKRRRATTSSSASARSSTSTASPRRRSPACRPFPPDMNYNDEVHRFAPRRRAVRAGRSRKAERAGRPDGRAEASAGARRSRSTRRAATSFAPRTCPGSRNTCTRRSRRSSGRRATTTARTSSAGRARRKRTGRSSSGSGWTSSVSSATKGGLVTTGDDAGYIYSLYGFGIARELELHEEAGFDPLEVIEHATWNGARMLGLDDRLGKVREGFVADLLVVNGNPLDEPEAAESRTATDVMLVNGRPVSNYTRAGSRRSGAGRCAAAASSGRSRTASRITCRRCCAKCARWSAKARDSQPDDGPLMAANDTCKTAARPGPVDRHRRAAHAGDARVLRCRRARRLVAA